MRGYGRPENKIMIIYNPKSFNTESAFISLSDWQFRKNADKKGNMFVEVMSGDKLIGQGWANKKEWIKTNKGKYEQVYYRPDEPIKFFWNYLRFEKPKTKEEKDREILIASIQ
jgi:hypothetical protein